MTLQKEYNKLFKAEREQYIGKCYKQDIEDENGFKTVYYKVLSFYDDETNNTHFWMLVVEEHIEEDINIPLSYIHRERADLLGHNKFFLRQLTAISEEEFSKALDTVYKHLMDVNNKVFVKDVESFKLRCPNCNSLCSIVYLYPNITDVEYTCENCGCNFIAKFHNGECIDVKEN